MRAGDVLVAGIGNRYLGDDGLGEATCDVLRPDLGDDVVLLAGLDDPLELISVWEGAGLAVVVDAVVSGAPPGTVHVLEIVGRVPRMLNRLSTHVLSVGDAVELARALDKMPERLVVVGVEAAAFEPGAPRLSPEAAAAVPFVAAIVRDLVAAETRPVPGA